jgi:hypothetical protein
MTIIQHDSCHDHPPVAPRSASRMPWLIASPARIALLAVAAVLAIDAGGTDDGPGLCVFRRCTGGYCPGCGLTRSARHLTRGQLGAAWHDHPWLVLAAVQAIVVAAVYGIIRRIGARVDFNRFLVVLGVVNVVLITGIWIARLVDGSIPRFF